MGSEASGEMMTLLQELAMLKDLDKKYENHPSESGREEHLLRQQRHEEITERIRTLGEQQKNEQSAS